ncbi:MAG: hypothetical protein JO098_08410 [Candidatus Eremiobacteraeota bacterium]|nr:hypothetical protein [Candidatus Eremiobacteraeota bacterium]
MADKCAHRSCSCEAMAGDQYCSAACSQQDENGRDCECGHGSCTGSSAAVTGAGRDVKDAHALGDMPNVVNPVI